MSCFVSCALLGSADAIGVRYSCELPRNAIATAHVQLFLFGGITPLVGKSARRRRSRHG